MLSDPERRATYDRYGREGLRGRRLHAGRLRPRQSLGHLRRLLRRVALRPGRPPGGPSRGGDVAASAEISLAEAFTRSLRQRRRRASRRRARRAAATALHRARLPSPATCAAAPAACSRSPRASSVSSCAPAPVRAARALGRIVETPCDTCDGIGRTLHDARVDIDIPAGIADGQRIRVRGKGTPASSAARRAISSSRSGSLPQPGIERDGDDLHTVVELTMTQAALGTSLVRSRARRARSRSRSRPAPSRETCRCCAGRACRPSRGGGAATSTCTPASTCPRRLDDEQRALVEQLGEALGEDAVPRRRGRRRLLRADQERIPLRMPAIPDAPPPTHLRFARAARRAGRAVTSASPFARARMGEQKAVVPGLG